MTDDEFINKHRSEAIAMYQHWIIAPNGSPSLCWWSWKAMDALLGCRSKRLAKCMGLVPAEPLVMEVERKEGKLFLHVRASNMGPARTIELPEETYARTIKFKEEMDSESLRSEAGSNTQD